MSKERVAAAVILCRAQGPDLEIFLAQDPLLFVRLAEGKADVSGRVEQLVLEGRVRVALERRLRNLEGALQVVAGAGHDQAIIDSGWSDIARKISSKASL